MDRNVAVLVLDSVRKDFFDAWTPRIQDLSGVSIDGARAPSSWSTPSHASMFTGDLPSEHGVHTYDRSFADTPSEELFHTWLPHDAIGVSANVFAGSAYGFDRYFDAFVDVTPAQRRPDGLDPLAYDSYGRFVLDAVRESNTVASLSNGIAGFLHEYWRELPGPKLVDDTGKAVRRAATDEIESATEPWFLFANFMDAHIPLQHFRGLDAAIHDADRSWSSDRYDVWDLMTGDYPEYWRVRESVYRAYVDYLDRLVAGFVADVRERTDRPTTVVITADHGENHGEASAHGMANHKASLSEQLLHVPLEIVDPPEAAEPVEGHCSLLDLPRLVSAISNDRWEDPSREVVPAEVMGMSSGPAPPANVDEAFYSRAIRAAYRGDTKYVWDSLGTRREYALDESTPSDQTLVAEDVTIPAWARSQFPTDLTEAADAARAGGSENEVSASVSARLEELGYM